MKLQLKWLIFLSCLKYSLEWMYYDSNRCPKSSQVIVEYYSIENDQYIFFSELVSWNEALLICPVYGARLASVETYSKAKLIAQKIADSNIEIEDMWIGGHQNASDMWMWLDETHIPTVPKNGYPPWTRVPNRTSKRCLAMDRWKHVLPLFIDLDCRLFKPFMCQRLTDIEISPEIIPPSQWVSNENKTYILFNIKTTWSKAVGFCRSKGYRLAMIETNEEVRLIAKAMIRSRPSLQNMWISGYYHANNWKWLPTGNIIPDVSNVNTNYPPWHERDANRSKGCILLNRHLANINTFIVARCDKRKDFICEKYDRTSNPNIVNNTVEYKNNISKFVLISDKLTWKKAQEQCRKKYTHLAEANNTETINFIIKMMADDESGIKHVWIGGRYIENNWKWVTSNKIIPFDNMPWYENEESDVIHSCLNLDRSQQDKPCLYGLKCKMKQPFVCLR